jgi:predicted O-methyltransferase YrrM
MNDQTHLNPPDSWDVIQAQTVALGFTMPSDALTCALLRTLAATKPGGRLLELGTGTGLATAWLADGMDKTARLISVDNDSAVQAVARAVLSHDSRIEIVTQDGGEFIEAAHAASRRFDLIFADTWPGKYTHLDQALNLVAPGGLYVVDDMLYQPNWPADHPSKVAALIDRLENLAEFAVVKLEWATGLIIATRRVE